MSVVPSGMLALVPAAGVGARSGLVVPKQYADVLGKSVLAHTLKALRACPQIVHTLVVVSPADGYFQSLELQSADIEFAAIGGATRADSVVHGLEYLRRRYADDTWVLVHDAARCCVTPALISRLISACMDDPVGGLLAMPVADTVKAGAGENRVEKTVSRDGLWLAQTPQMFRLGVVHDALVAAVSQNGAPVTDEASAIEAKGLFPKLVRGASTNIKVTLHEDFALAACILQSQQEKEASCG